MAVTHRAYVIPAIGGPIAAGDVATVVSKAVNLATTSRYRIAIHEAKGSGKSKHSILVTGKGEGALELIERGFRSDRDAELADEVRTILSHLPITYTITKE